MKLVDSSAWIEFLRRRGDPLVREGVRLLVDNDEAAYTCPILFELLSGAKPGEAADLEKALSYCERIYFEAHDWRAAAALESELRARGLTLPRNDLFVMTVAIRTGLPVVCRDAHFTTAAKVFGPRLKVEQI